MINKNLTFQKDLESVRYKKKEEVPPKKKVHRNVREISERDSLKIQYTSFDNVLKGLQAFNEAEVPLTDSYS